MLNARTVLVPLIILILGLTACDSGSSEPSSTPLRIIPTFGLSGTPNEIVNEIVSNFYNAIMEPDVERALEYLEPDGSLQTASEKEEYAEYLEDYIIDSLERMEYRHEVVYDDYAYVYVYRYYPGFRAVSTNVPDENDVRDKIELVKVDGKWRIISSVYIDSPFQWWYESPDDFTPYPGH